MTATPIDPQPPRRNFFRVFIVAAIAAVVLCGVAFLPERSIVIMLIAPIAAVFLPSIIFSAAKLRCPACQKPLPLAFTGNACPECKAPLALETNKPATRV